MSSNFFETYVGKGGTQMWKEQEGGRDATSVTIMGTVHNNCVIIILRENPHGKNGIDVLAR